MLFVICYYLQVAVSSHSIFYF